MQRSDFNFFLELAIRWGDMDALGHVNNVQYFRYLESGRIAYLEHLGKCLASGSAAVEKNIVLADMQCSFLQQLHYPAIIEVGIRTSHIGNSSFQLSCAIYRKDKQAPAATARAVLVWFDFNTQRACPLPDAFRTAIKKFEAVAPTY